MKEVVWIFGTSATGKETFIQNIHSNKQVLDRLGWAGLRLAACAESIEHIGQFDGDPVTNLRGKIIETVPKMLESADVVLIKWQITDSRSSRPQHLRKATPDAKQRIILLTAPETELVNRIMKKAWWHDFGKEKEFIAEESAMTAGAIKDLGSDFEVTTIDSSNDSYEVLAEA
jgi:predicted kinase